MHPSNASAKAELIGSFLEIMFYGVYLVVFCQCLKVLHNKRSEGRPSAVLGVTALAIFALVTVHMIMDFMRAMQAFTSHTDVPDAAIQYYTVVRRHLDLIKSGCYIAMTIISDGLIGYRTWIVWGRNRFLAIIPVMLLLADIALGVYAVWLLAQTEPGDNALLGLVTERVKYFYAITLALNLLCTILISYKIWQVYSEVGRYSRTARLMRPSGSRVILVIVESAAIYSAMLVILIATSATNTPIMLATLNVISPIIGIVFSMVIIRFSMDRTKWDSLKITTHLNFVSGTFPTDGPESPTDSPDMEAGLGRTDIHIMEKGSVESHIHPQTRYEPPLHGSLFSHSKASLPEFFV